MANIDQKPSRYMLNLLHVLPAFTDEEKGIVHTIVEVSSGSINKYELITESGQLKLDRVGYSSLAYPFTYGAIPLTWDIDNDPLDIEIVNITEPIVPGAVVEARIIGAMKFIDGGEVDDKVIAVLADDKRVSHIQSVDDLGEYFKRETTYYWENYKTMKKPDTGKVGEFLNAQDAIKLVKESIERYEKEYKPLLAE
ncbi:Inorganic pyrophosphatase [hydrothermal vent metagenome]|uniref:inorganic diphosphatase n=1 Tax=hydrothermal vent metagenome TaxID=652676 RepID=A0A3B0UP66_9ZZZZ|nr:inorganic diphosphatase [Candidatus Kaiserbacteria bacterium]